MPKKYDNGRWVTTVLPLEESTSVNSATGADVTGAETVSSGSTTTTSDTSKKDYVEASYDIIEGTVDMLQADMGIQCRGAVNLQGLGPVFSGTYYVSAVKISMTASSLKQSLTLHRDNLAEKRQELIGSSRLAMVNLMSATQTYTVKRGDNLSAIARKELGKASRWTEIYNLNKSVIGSNPNLIYAGQVLVLPA